MLKAPYPAGREEGEDKGRGKIFGDHDDISDGRGLWNQKREKSLIPAGRIRGTLMRQC